MTVMFLQNMNGNLFTPCGQAGPERTLRGIKVSVLESNGRELLDDEVRRGRSGSGDVIRRLN